MKMYQLTIEQKDQLIGLTYDGYSYFYPVQDISDNWFIGDSEAASTVYEWLKDLPLVDFQPKITTEENI